MAKKKGKPQQNNHVADIENLHVTDTLFYGLAETMTGEQIEYAESILHNQITWVDAKAGTGKSQIAIACAKYLFENNVVDQLVYVISPCETNTLGHLPGDVDEKIANYMGALYDSLAEIGEMPDKALDEQYGWVKATSYVYMRGINLKKSIVIIDECQNFDKASLKRVLTRISDDCHVVCVGSSIQCDLKNPKNSGFIPMMEHFKKYAEERGITCGFCNLTKNFRGELSNLADELPM